MTSAPSTAPAGAAGHATFFRQSGWMVIATVVGGIFMWAVHFLSKAIPASEYGTFVTLLSAVNLLPALPLQMVFSQQTARAVATGREAQLAGFMRWTWLGILMFCFLGGGLAWHWQQTIETRWSLANPASLILLLLVIFLSLLWPVFAGTMQGGQNFLWLGWCTIFNGAGRLLLAAGIVFVCRGYAAGIMIGVVGGLLVACLAGAWQTRALWGGAGEPFDRGIILRQVMPLLLGFIATQFLFSADTIFVSAYFGAERTAAYGAAGTLSRALLWLVLPVATVMFPKLVHSTATAQKTGLLGLALMATAVLATLGFLSLWLLGPWVVPVVFPPSYARATLAVLPWYAGAMVPLALANVVVNDLLARSRFGIVPPLLILAAGYGVMLTWFHDTQIMVLQLLGGFTLLLLAVCAAYAWFDSKGERTPSQPEPFNSTADKRR